MQKSTPLKEQLMLLNALGVSNNKDIDQLIRTSHTARRFTNALQQLGKCPEFYTLLFSVHDSEIPFETRNALATSLQQTLYSNNLKEFISTLHDHLGQASDDYETGYYLVMLECVKEFMETPSYREFYDAKAAFDNDHCPANEQLKESIASLKQQVRELMYPSTMA